MKMETYIVTIYAKKDHAADVQQYYQDLQNMYEEASGFISRKIFRAKTGAMEQAVKATYSEEELASTSKSYEFHNLFDFKNVNRPSTCYARSLAVKFIPPRPPFRSTYQT